MTDPGLPDTFEADGVREVRGMFLRERHTKDCPGFLDELVARAGHDVRAVKPCPECNRKIRPSEPKQESSEPWWGDR